jgi:hypothetical protein
MGRGVLGMMEFLKIVGLYLNENIALVGLLIISLIFLSFFFLSIDLFNIRKEAVETNMRIAETNRKMNRMHEGIKELVHYFMIVSEDIKEMKEKKDSVVSQEKIIGSGNSTLHDHVVV